MACHEINAPLRIAAFLAQAAHESALFTRVEENLNYSATAIRDTWPGRFTEKEALEYARQPERIANRAYGGRMGNGDEASGDGWRYRGRGLFQLTGKDDYRDCSLMIGGSLVEHPDRVLDPPVAASAAGWEWQRGKLNPLADEGKFEKITRIINGGMIGFEERLALYKRIKMVLGVA